MNETWKKILWVIAGIAFILLIVYLVYENNPKKEEAQNAPSEEQIREDKLKNELVEKYGAVVFADQDFEFSKDIQEKSSDNFLLKGTINDIYIKNEKYYVQFSSQWFSDYTGIFEVSNELYDQIKNNFNKKSILKDYFAVVKIDNALKPMLKINGYQEGLGEDEQILELNADGNTNIFLLRGSLIDIREIE